MDLKQTIIIFRVETIIFISIRWFFLITSTKELVFDNTNKGTGF